MSLRALEAGGSGHPHEVGAGQRVSVQFEDLDQQNESYIVGMWSFLVTEIMFFGALFLAYSLYRVLYFEAYLEAHQFLDVKMGTINTFILLSSSLSMVLGVHAAQHGKRNRVIGLLGFTCLCALGFMVVKYFEYTKKFHEGLFPDQRFNYARALYMHHEESREAGGAHAGNPRASRAWDAIQKAKSEGGEISEEGFTPAVSLMANPEYGFDTRVATPARDTVKMAVLSPASSEYKIQAGHAKLFFSLYFVMTGLHGIHVLIGVGMMAFLMFLYYTKNAAVDDYMPLEMIGLYWHFVDLVWIFLFPMMYLIS